MRSFLDKLACWNMRCVLIVLMTGAVAVSLAACYWQVRWHLGLTIPLAVASLVVLAALTRVYGSVFQSVDQKWRWWCPLSICVLCLIVHSLAYWFVGEWNDQCMTSDFASAQKCLESGSVCVIHPWRVRYWCHYEFVLSVLGVCFGPHLWVGQLLNAVMISLSVVPIYWLVNRISNRMVATFISLLWAFSPALLLYGTILTGEFLGVFFLLIGFCGLISMEDDRPLLARLALGIGAGVCLAISQAFKPVAIILIIAFAVAEGVTYVRCDTSSGKRLLAAFVRLVAIYLVLKMTTALIAFGMAVVFPDSQTMAGRHPSAVKLLAVGLNAEHDGAWSTQNDVINAMSKEESREFLIRMLRRQGMQTPVLVVKKFVRLYQSDNWVKSWLAYSFRNGPSRSVEWLVDVGVVQQKLCFLLGAGFLLFGWWRKSLGLELATAVFIVVGFTALLLLIEFQGRYRMSIFPFYYLIMAYGLSRFQAKTRRESGRL